MIQVLIVDDHTIVRQGIKQILDETPDIAAVDFARNGREAIDKARAGNFDVVLLDMAMPDLDGLSVLNVIKQDKPAMIVLVLSMYPEEQYAIRVLRAGAAGYLTKESASEELIDAIRKVSQGGRYVSRALAERLAFALGPDSTKPAHETLSEREFQVFHLLAQGKSVVEIATQLALSAKTISTYRTRILEKLQLKSNAELIYYAAKHSLS